MPKYRVVFEVYATTWVEVEAPDADEAIDIAANKANISLCYHCARKVEISDLGDATEVAEL